MRSPAPSDHITVNRYEDSTSGCHESTIGSHGEFRWTLKHASPARIILVPTHISSQTGSMTDYSTTGSPTGTSNSNLPAILAHLSAPIANLVSVGWLAIVGPLIVWAMYKERDSFVRQEAANAFNFQITMWVLSVVGAILCYTFILIPVGLVLLLISSLGSLVFAILAAVTATRGQSYRYPWKLNLIN